MRINVVPAGIENVPVVHRMLDRARAWLASRGIAQWEAPFRQQEFLDAATDGRLFLAIDTDSQQPVGSLQLALGPEDAWKDVSGEGLHVHRLVITRSAAGSGVGSTLLDWAQQQAESRGLEHLRLDCAEYNLDLIAHYEKLGFSVQGHSKITRITDGGVLPVVLLQRTRPLAE